MMRFLISISYLYEIIEIVPTTPLLPTYISFLFFPLLFPSVADIAGDISVKKLTYSIVSV